MSSGIWPRPKEIQEYYERLREALQVLDRQFSVVTTDPKSKFAGMLRDDFDDLLERTRGELDAEVVLALVAGSEAVLRKDFERRLHHRTKDPVRRRFQELETEGEKRIRLKQILTVWQAESGEAKRVDRFRRLLLRRHWLAHGRYWSDKSGVAPDPAQAWLVIDDLFQALTRCLKDFPLL